MTDNPLDLSRVHPPAGGNDLSTNVFGDSGGTVEREEERRLELGLCALNFRLCHSLREAGPLAKGEVDEVVNSSNFVGDEIDSPEAARGLENDGKSGVNGEWDYPVSEYEVLKLMNELAN